MILYLTESILKKFIEKQRPPIEIRDEYDIGYSYDKSVVILFEIRPDWIDSKKKMYLETAKIRYYKSQKIWKLYWLRASGKWELYAPFPTAKSIEHLLKVIEEDKQDCFWG